MLTLSYWKALIGRKNEKQKTENEVEFDIVSVIKNAANIVFVLLSAQNIDRVISFYKASLRTKRLFVTDVYSAYILDSLKDLAKVPYPSDEYSNIRVFFPYWLCRKLAKEGYQEVMYKFKRFKITKKEISENLQRIMMLIRPSMIPDLLRLKGIESSSVVYSMWNGYLNDGSMDSFLNFIKEKHMKLVSIHSSGHAGIETLKKAVNTIRPKMIIPIHTLNPDCYQGLFPNTKVKASFNEDEITI